MVASFRDGRSDVVRVEGLDVDLLRVAGIYGPNAAGKSNVLAALEFMQSAVAESHRVWKPEGAIPVEPFLLDPTSPSAPSLFEVDVLIQGVRYQYGFKLDRDRVLEEWLYAYPKGRRQVWFHRDSSAPQPFTFGKQLKGNNRVIEALTRKNSLFLSAAAENNHQALLPIYSWFGEALFFSPVLRGVDGWSTSSVLRFDREVDKGTILGLLALADLGVTDLEIDKSEKLLKDADGQVLARVGKIPELKLRHQAKGGSVWLPFDKESRGTQTWLFLSGLILRILARGGVLCIDELDTSLHAHLAAEVLRIFQDPKRNPNNAQLLFNTHDTTLLGNLLGEPALHRDQVWFVEKDDEGATHLYPLTDFKPRKLENLERGYLQGRYGAIPFIEPQLLTRDA